MDVCGVLADALPVLLQLYWILCTGGEAAVILSACRGKLVDMKPPKAFGPLSDWTVPQKWFAHFYAIGALCTLAIFGAELHLPSPTPATKLSLLALAAFEIHLVRRYLETTVLMRYPPTARMHGIAYVYGLRQGGGLFELVSCPHYFAEIVIYGGLALLVVNLILAAGMTQRWYRRQFKSYPPRRKALVPWVY
ncbi:hypothetical protein QBZ16_002869 [Prototheca wickerhamii]|uniref:3-oxo-5-alpha-steroid 4-dehydrogenase C-terminal domain-containing protein n=1 Tax=Prototheca wickerhamii TaxID=3111 RepID=A0AAD9IIZ4_PROWI|nr:hypothetical protein QBZ16_002869 [Prototheca wickerhamii]